MSETAAPSARTRDFERFLTLIDAIVAIAITLLVLPLVDVVGELDDVHGSVWHLVRDNRGPIGAFVLSFVVIANLWMFQHRILARVVAANEALTRLMLLWTLTIVTLPFPTALVASSSGEQAATKILYIGTMSLSALVLGLVAVIINRHPELRDSDDVLDPARSFITLGTFLVALVVMLLLPPVGYWPLLLLLLTDQVLVVWHRAVR